MGCADGVGPRAVGKVGCVPAPGPGYAITARVEVPASASAAGDLTVAVGRVGGVVTAFDVVEAHAATVVVDISFNARDEDHAGEITDAVGALPGVRVRKVSDRTFLVHLGGKLEVHSKVSLRNRDDLSRAYTPGVARVCQAIAANPADARRLTIKRNTVAVVTDGSAVLGLGNLGAAAAMPVMEGKAALFKRFAGVDAWPVCLDTQDTEEIIRTVQILAPGYGGINLEDIAAPRCFEIEARLRELLDIPVFHDDQHGTAVVVLAALRNALEVVGQEAERLPDRGLRGRCGRVGGDPAAASEARLARCWPWTSTGSCTPDGPGWTRTCPGSPQHTNPARGLGTLADAMVGADVFIGCPRPNLFGAAELATMAERAIVFALANPDPEVDPAIALATPRWSPPAARTTRTRSTTCSPSPGSSGACWTRTPATSPTRMLLAAAAAIADRVTEPNPSFIVPSVFDASVAPAVAEAVRQAAARHDPAAGPEGYSAKDGLPGA